MDLPTIDALSTPLFSSTSFHIPQDVQAQERIKLTDLILENKGIIDRDFLGDYQLLLAPDDVQESYVLELAKRGKPIVGSSWIFKSIEAKQLVPIDDLRARLAPTPVNIPTPKLPPPVQSLSDSSVAAGSPIPLDRIKTPQLFEAQHSPMSVGEDLNGDVQILDEKDEKATTARRPGRGAAYTESEIELMKEHFTQQSLLEPPPSMSAIWNAFAFKHPQRKSHAWQQFYYNHKAMFTALLSGGVQSTHKREEVVEAFSPQPESGPATKTTPFIPLSPIQTIKRGADSSGDDGYSEPSGSRRSSRPRVKRRLFREGSDYNEAGALMSPIPSIPAGSYSQLHKTLPRHYAALPKSPFTVPAASTTMRRAPGSWLPEFTSAEKRALVTWIITRETPTNVIQNVESIIEFAKQNAEHAPEEWLCHYLKSLPTFKSLESHLI